MGRKAIRGPVLGRGHGLLSGAAKEAKEMMVGVCGVACEMCPRRVKGQCPNGAAGCVARENRFCAVCTCAFTKGVKLCFQCPEFPCETTKQGPIVYGYCQFIAGQD